MSSRWPGRGLPMRPPLVRDAQTFRPVLYVERPELPPSRGKSYRGHHRERYLGSATLAGEHRNLAAEAKKGEAATVGAPNAVFSALALTTVV
jgi:hypothetical protein